MKKTSTLIVLTLLFILSILTLSFSDGYCQNNTGDYLIETIERKVEIKYGDYIVVYDAVTLKSSGDSTVLDSFLLGFPYEYKSNILGCYGYNFNNSQKTLKATFSEGEVPKLGFNWMEIPFPATVELKNGESYSFNILTIFENIISETKENVTWRYTLHFPAYPSLTKKVNSFKGSIFLPLEINYTLRNLEEFTGTTVEVSNTTTNTIISYTRENLEEFTYKPKKDSWISFLAAEPAQRIILNELERIISIDETGGIHVSDEYFIISKSIEEVDSIDLALPWNTSEPIKVLSESGKTVPKPRRIDDDQNIYSIKIVPAMQTNESRRFKITYSLPKNQHVTQKSFENFNFNLSLLDNMNLLVRKFSLTIKLPEGTKILDAEISTSDYSVFNRKVFTDSISYIFDEPIIPLVNLEVHINYHYNILWSSFRPTLWIGTTIALAYVVALVWQRIKLKQIVVTPALRISSEDLRQFVEAYEEKRRTSSVLEALETKARKGKIPRRRYKIRKKTLESRILSLNKRIAELKERIRGAGARYADAIGQLEVAETELETVEMDIQRIEARYRRGEVSRSAYRKLLEEYNKRKEKAIVTIDGVLLRFSEEIR